MSIDVLILNAAMADFRNNEFNLAATKPPVNPEYPKDLVPANGSADMTTDWFCRGRQIVCGSLL